MIGPGPLAVMGFPVVNTGRILNEYLPYSDHDEGMVDRNAATGLRVNIYDAYVRVEAWNFKDGHSSWSFAFIVSQSGRK